MLREDIEGVSKVLIDGDDNSEGDDNPVGVCGMVCSNGGSGRESCGCRPAGAIGRGAAKALRAPWDIGGPAALLGIASDVLAEQRSGQGERSGGAVAGRAGAGAGSSVFKAI